MPQKITDRKKTGGHTFMPLTSDFLVLQRVNGLIDNALYVLQSLQLTQPFHRVHEIRPHHFRQQIGAPWGGEMPERSFNQAIAKLSQIGWIAVTKDPDTGSWQIWLSEEIFSCCDPARSCRGSGRVLPTEPLNPPESKEKNRSKKRTDRSKPKGLKNQKPEQLGKSAQNGSGSGSVPVFDQSVSPETSSHRSEESSLESSYVSVRVGNAGLDQISAALKNSGGDENFVLELISDGDSGELRSLARQLAEATDQQVRDAVAAMKQQRGKLKNPVRWLISAVKKRFRPNQPSPENMRVQGAEKRWRELALDRGIIRGSQSTSDGVAVTQNGTQWVPIAQAMKMWPQVWLDGLPPRANNVLASSRRFIELGCPELVDEAELAAIGVEFANGHFGPSCGG